MTSKSKLCKKYLKIIGKSVTLVMADGSEKQFFAAVQQTWRKNKTRFESIATEIGQNQNGYYIFLGPYDVDVTQLSENDTLICDGIKYYFVVSERVLVGNDIQFYTGVLKRVYEEDENVFN